MNAFKKKPLVCALRSVFAPAPNLPSCTISETETAFEYPYYSIREEKKNAIEVTFVGGRNSREVLDFNLYLSPHDVWCVKS